MLPCQPERKPQNAVKLPNPMDTMIEIGNLMRVPIQQYDDKNIFTDFQARADMG